MDFDDKQFQERKADYLNGDEFKVPNTSTTMRATGYHWENIDDLMMQMYLDDVSKPAYLALFQTASDMMMRQMAYISELMSHDHGDAQEANKAWLASTVGDWMVKAFRKDSDFVDEAVNLILDGEAGRYFE